METDATRMCALLVGLPDVNVIGVVQLIDVEPVAHISSVLQTNTKVESPQGSIERVPDGRRGTGRQLSKRTRKCPVICRHGPDLWLFAFEGWVMVRG